MFIKERTEIKVNEPGVKGMNFFRTYTTPT